MGTGSAKSPQAAFRTEVEPKVAIFSCAPYDREWFDRTNQAPGSGRVRPNAFRS